MELIKLLAKKQECNIIAGRCNFYSKGLADFKIPCEAVIFTSYATMYIPEISADFVKSVCELNPSVVISVEPCYEHYSDETLLGMMRSRYIQVNDYNRNLVSLLHEQQRLGKIIILEEQINVFGINPLLPASILVWKPA